MAKAAASSPATTRPSNSSACSIMMAVAICFVWISSRWCMTDAASEQVVLHQPTTLRNLIGTDRQGCIKNGPSSGSCNSDSDCCTAGSTCYHHSGCFGFFDCGTVHYCCGRAGAACRDRSECCEVEVTLNGISLFGGNTPAGCDAAGKYCCAPFGTYCEKHSDCCPRGNKPSECYKADHQPKKYCR